MRPIYMHVSYIKCKIVDGNKCDMYGGSVFKITKPMTEVELNKYISDALSKDFGFEVGDVQIMSMSVLPKRVYKMLKGIQ